MWTKNLKPEKSDYLTDQMIFAIHTGTPHPYNKETKAKETQGIEYFYSFNHFSSEASTSFEILVKLR